MAAVLARAVCMPLEMLDRGCDAIARCGSAVWNSCPALPPSSRDLLSCASCEALFQRPGSACLAFTVLVSLCPGIAGLVYGLRELASTSACTASDGAAVGALSIQMWLVGQFVLALLSTLAAMYIFIHLQAPLDPRVPHKASWQARAKYLACDDPVVAVVLLAEVAQLAWLIIGAKLRNWSSACSLDLLTGFVSVLYASWAFFLGAFVGGVLSACCAACEATHEAFVPQEAAVAQVFLPQQQVFPPPFRGGAPEALQGPFVTATAVPYASPFAVDVPVAAAAGAADWNGPAPPVAVAIAGPPAQFRRDAPYGSGAHPPDSLTDLARAGIGLVSVGVRMGARAATQAAGVAAVAAQGAVTAVHQHQQHLQQQQQQQRLQQQYGASGEGRERPTWG
jgi:hypothetical protein